MTQPEKSDSGRDEPYDRRVGLDELVAAFIGRTLPDAGFVNVTWRGGEIHARHASGDRVRIRVEVPE